MKMQTTYMGLTLNSPIVVSACTLSEQTDNIALMEDSGAGAVVLESHANRTAGGRGRLRGKRKLKFFFADFGMVAGLIKESTRQNINGTPGLRKLPILGTLFRSRDFVSNETELVVLVTPILVRPTTQAKLTTPDKGFIPASDKQGIFFGRINKVYGNGDAPQGSYNGNVGFIVE